MRVVFTSIVFLLFTSIASIFAQEKSTFSASKSLDMYVFPTKDQGAEQQSKDEADCYAWAKEQTGYDPMNPTVVSAKKVDTSPDGSAIVGSARGAAGGAAIGAICGDAGKGAAIGAVAGAVRGRRAKKHGDAMRQSSENQSAQQSNEKMVDDFKKAFSVCMESKGYNVK